MKTKSRFSSSALAALLAGLPLTAPTFAGSLWKDGITDERGMFADKRAKRVGDIVTIVVQETVSMSDSLRLKTDKAAKGIAGTASDLINQFIQYPAELLRGKYANQLPKDFKIPEVNSIAAAGSNEYTGGGEIKNSQTIATRCAVQVIDTLPNGNLVVEGIREISFSKERQFASMRGIIRTYDVQADNTVLSSNVADARIEIVSEGTLTEAQKKGWLLRLSEKINPF
jgi:flagellar L-ring protein precursor FlgH